MACYSDKVKSIAAKVVGAISVVVVIAGIICIILGAIQMGSVQKPDNWSGMPAFDQSGLGIGILVLGAIALLTGLCGFATCKCKKPCFTIPFILLTLVIGVIVLIIGLLILGAAKGLVDDAQAKLCDAVSVSEGGKEVSYKYNQAVQNFVCSQTCPCPTGANGEIEKMWTTMDEATFNEWNRTKKATADTAKGYAPLIFTSDTTKSFASWRDCYE
jgi:ABC-type transport system involved in multi-copper enzyme maturation permease subunit